MGVKMKKNKILNLTYKVIYQDIPNLAYSIAYITPLVSNHSDDISEIKEVLKNLSRRVDRIERNSD